MLSGAQQVYAASERPAMFRLAADLATGHPRAQDHEMRMINRRYHRG
jgi:hypothetical protein